MEHGRERKPSREGWVEERCLGAGGFGTVTLYENKITKEQVALKRCRLELNRHNRKRWQQEVDIMKRLNHPNLVSAKDVPSSLDVGEGELPLLAMEFCSGGDLRKVLNSPESCCGLKEKTVLKIASDIAAAVEFLHGHRIIHRDLKPENVVLSHVDKKVVYKLIDLGYAKELDQGSLATTFVGTLKYLAPELLDKVQYTKTVDYWSFGTVLFECITGLRPFLPELSPVQWHNEVRKKGPDDICAYFDVKGDIQFSSVLPTPNALCRLFQDKFVTLLRLLLLWDPLSRGGPVNDGGKRLCFTTLEQVISTVVVYVFSFSTATVHSYEVLPTDTVEDLQVKLWEETGLDVGEQEVLMASGQTVEPHTLVQDCLALDKVEEDCLLFLLSTSDQPKAARPLYSIPPTIQGMVTEPKTLMSYEELKRAFALGVNFCREQRKICCLLFEGFRAALISLLKLNSTLGQMKNDLIIEFHKLESKIDSFNSSLDTDFENYSDAVDILKDDKLLRKWKQTQKKVQSFRDHDVAQLKEAITALQTPVLELQKSAYAGGTQPKMKLDEMYERAIQLYEDLRQRDRRQVMEDCNKMASVIVQSITMREKLCKDIFARLSRVVLCKREIREMMPRLHATKGELVQKGGAIKEMQKQRQVDLWTVLKTTRQEQGEPRRVSSSSTGSLSLSLSLSPVYSPCVSGDSLLLMESSSKSLERFAEVLSSLKVDQISQAECLDWKFLEEDHDSNNSGSV